MREKIKHMKVDKKLRFAFSMVLGVFVIAMVFSIVGLAMVNLQMKNFYREAHANAVLQMEIRKDIQVVGKNVLWAMMAEDAQETQQKIEDANTYGDKVGKNIETLEKNFSNKEIVAKLDEAVQKLKASRQEVLSLESAGKEEEAFALFSGDYVASTEEVQDVLIEIGDIAEKEAAEAYRVTIIIGCALSAILLIVLIVSAIACQKFATMITKSIKEPIDELETAAEQLRNGDLDVSITYESSDEMGVLANNFRIACAQLHEIVTDAGNMLGEMANGNFNVNTKIEEKYAGNFELLLTSMRTLNRQLDQTLRNINEVSNYVAAGAEQLAESATDLAEGATDQAGVVEELTATVENVASIAGESAEAASQAASRMSDAAKEAESNRENVLELTAAMESISDTSKEIENIIAAIEDIASQTNLLSLNASIEAARAGEAGRGFAVVADQIGKLAADSANSAVTTRSLIVKALQEIERGNEITKHTAGSITKILEEMTEFAGVASGSAEGSRQQAEMLKQIEQGIEQVSVVVQSNSAAAQETSSVSEELSAQTESLNEMVGKFRLRTEE